MKKKTPEFCYLEIPNGEDVLTLLGADQIAAYGYNEKGQPSRRLHFHNLLEIGICRWGCGEVNIDGKRYPFGTGSIMVIPKNIPHAVANREQEKSFWEYVYLNPALFLEQEGGLEKRERAMYLELIEGCPFFKNRDEAPFLAAEINLLMDQIRTQGFGYRQCVRGLAYCLLMETAKMNYVRADQRRTAWAAGTDKTQKISKALDYIDEHYHEKIQLSDIAGAAYISPSYLRKLFMEYCGMSPMQYLNYVRIHGACRLMGKTDDNISEVARKVGYDNLATFINNFKLYMGETPRQWKTKFCAKV